MKSYLIVLLKALLWLLIVILLRPINYALDWSLAAYCKMRDKSTDKLSPGWCVLALVCTLSVVIAIVFFIVTYYG